MKAVILAGGEGLGLFPLSSRKKPKQFHRLVSKKTLLQESYERVEKVFLRKNIYIVTNNEYASLVKEQLPKIETSNLLLEPLAKNTAAAIGLAAVHLDHRTPREIMAVFYTNHLVEQERALFKALDIAEKIVKIDNFLVSIDVNPSFPSDKLGYVKIGRALREIGGQIVFEFKDFVEKPTFEQAKKFLESWEYLWNTGFMVVRTDKLLALYKKYLPQLHTNFLEIGRSLETEKEEDVKRQVYEKIESLSFDYGLMEKIEPKEVAVIPADLGWVDVRTWPVVYGHLRHDRKGNVIRATAVPLETQNSLIFGKKKKLIVTLGVKDLVIVDTDEVLFVGDRQKSERMREVVKQLEKKVYL